MVFRAVDVENVKEFLRQVETLPCKVPEAKLLEVRSGSWCPSLYIMNLLIQEQLIRIL